MREVSEEKFNRLLEKHIDLKPCKRCGYPTGEIVVRLPIYGRYGAVVRCGCCGAETKIHGVTYTMFCGKRMATPTIKSSLMGGIERAIQDWNGGGGTMSKEKQIEEMAKLLNRCAAECEEDCICSEKEHAEALYNAGYRKQRDGRWIKHRNEKTCSQCKFVYYSNNDDWNFCPNCGAKMKGVTE